MPQKNSIRFATRPFVDSVKCNLTRVSIRPSLKPTSEPLAGHAEFAAVDELMRMSGIDPVCAKRVLPPVVAERLNTLV